MIEFCLVLWFCPPSSSNSQIFCCKYRRGRWLSSEFWSGEGHWFLLPALYVSEWSQCPPNKTAAKAVCCGDIAVQLKQGGGGCLGRAWLEGSHVSGALGSVLKLTVGQFSKFSIDFNYFSVFKKNQSIRKCLSSCYLVVKKWNKKFFFLRIEKRRDVRSL